MYFLAFCRAVGRHWWALMSCAIFTLLGAYVLYAHKSDKWAFWATGIMAVFCLLMACYLAWVDEYKEVQKEKAKNEVAPEINIRECNSIPYGNLAKGLTDLFVNLELELKSPSHVSILEYSLTLEHDAQSFVSTAVEDIDQWELEKRRRVNNESFHLSCIPIVRKLTVRGDPVRGWIHFTLPNVTEGFLASCTLLIKIKCIYGTCWYRFQTNALPDPQGRGVMRKIIKHETA